MIKKITNLKDDLTTKASEIKDAVKEKMTRKNDMRSLAERKVNLKISLKIHLAAFIFVGILLVVINLLFSPGYLWVIEAMVGWTIGYFLHIIAYFLYSKPSTGTGKTDLIFHFIIYVVVNAYLVARNLAIPSYPWVIYPIIFWGFGVAVHAIVYYLYIRDVKNPETGEPISKKQRAIDKELEKMKARGDVHVAE